MNVLLVSNGFPPSGQWGTEFYTYQLARGLADRGHAVDVLCPLRDGSRPRYTLQRSTRYGVALHELPLKEMQAIESRITKDVFGVLSVESSVKSRTSFGGTAPKNVASQAKAWAKRLGKERKSG